MRSSTLCQGGLPGETVREMLIEAVESRYGAVDAVHPRSGAIMRPLMMFKSEKIPRVNQIFQQFKY